VNCIEWRARSHAEINGRVIYTYTAADIVSVVAVTSAVRCGRCSRCNNQALKDLSPQAVYHDAVSAAAAVADIAARDKFFELLDKPGLHHRIRPADPYLFVITSSHFTDLPSTTLQLLYIPAPVGL